MSASQHTPVPWSQLPQNGAGPMIVHDFETGNQMNPIGYRLIAHMLQRRDSLDEDQANGDFIVRACNAHDDLVAALRALLSNPHLDLGDLVYDVREAEGLGWEGPSVKAWSDAVTAAKAALAKVTS